MKKKMQEFDESLESRPSGKVLKRTKMLDYLSNPENEWPDRQTLAVEILGYSKSQSLWNLFTGSELNVIEQEALDIRRKRCATTSAKVDQALLDKALNGDVRAIRLFYQRYENWSERQILDYRVEALPLITITQYTEPSSD